MIVNLLSRKNRIGNAFAGVAFLAIFQCSILYGQTDKGNDQKYPLNNGVNQPSEEKVSQTGLPASIHDSIVFDTQLNGYWIYRKVGKLTLQGPYYMSIPEYQSYTSELEKRKYWNEKSKILRTASATPGFKPQIVIGSEAVGGIFGNNTINIVPQGSVEIIFGINSSKTENPNLSERARKSTTFDFRQKTQVNVAGSIGDKFKVGINYNTESTFEFENKTKLEYAGKEDEIIKKVEAGNVSLPLSGSLITGSQSLFGLKTELQFGKLNVTTVASQQKGETSTIEVQSGASTSTFEIQAGNYETNKHFFLSHFFRDHYENALKTTPVISSGIVITKVEVWVTNKSSSYTDCRNIVAFTDLAESGDYIYNTVPAFAASNVSYPENTVPNNDINGLYSSMTTNYSIRDISAVTTSLSPLNTQNFYSGKDYEKVENARKLTSNEYTLNSTLGYISLNSALASNAVLAVAYEYTYDGKTYKVGELSSSGISAPNTLVLKLIKGTTFTPKLPTWNLMMKNVYALNAYQVSSDFEFNVLYQNDNTGTNVNYIPEPSTNKDILLRTMGLDYLNSSNEAYPDGQFDFLDGITINASKGRIIFPVLEPFGSTMKKYLNKKGITGASAKKYIFQELYDSTQTKALQISEKNKYILKGKYSSTSSSEISLNATNIPQGSVVVTAGGQTLTENIDYTVDYNLGTVKIINSGLLESSTTIRVSFESNSLYNIQTKTLLGTHLEYKFSDKLSLGGTIENLSEKPLTSKVSVGDEPISNTIWGLNGTYKSNSQFLTTLLDKLPLLQTKETSQLELQGEFAQLIPGHSKAIGKTGSLYLDDFEGSESSIELKTVSAWSLASVPADKSLFPESALTNNHSMGKNRARLSWYTIDPIFATMSSSTPKSIKNNENARSSHFVRKITEQEIFKNADVSTATNTYIPELNLAFFPKERGPYNFDSQNLSATGELLNPEDRWGGIQRELTTTDFETSNIEYIEFWLMDPFAEDTFKTNKGGNLYFDLGEVSEDVLNDSRKSFENGLPTTATVTDVDTTVWGRVPNTTSLTDAFDNSSSTRQYQDIGLDGLSDTDEETFFSDYVDNMKNNLPADSKALEDVIADPSTDDFKYYLNDDYDNNNAGIIERYKKYNGLENNSPTGSSSSNSTLPNTEDIDNDNTINETESFFQYKVSLKRDSLKVGSNFIVDSVVTDPVKLANGKSSSVTWYQFRVPIEEYQKKVGSIEDFTSIRFMRMFLKGFQDSVILRFAYLNLVRGEWRKYQGSLISGGEGVSIPEAKNTSFDISAVNIEENGDKTPVNYVLPPGVSREVDPSSSESLELNEQSMVLKVQDLNNGSARAAYKTVSVNLLNYGTMKMDVHAEQITGSALADNELSLFIRMGSDYTTNYYEYEIPLKVTPAGYYSDANSDRLIVWPAANKLNIDLSNFTSTKLARNKAMNNNSSSLSLASVYPYSVSGDSGTYYVCGSPSLSTIKTIMIGVRYPGNSKYASEVRSAEVWVNELRLTDFKEKGGVAANLQAKMKLADLGYLNVSGNFSTPGFGSIDQKISERSHEQTVQYNVSSNLELGKFLPAKLNAQVPFFANISQTIITPEYDPTNPDIKLKSTLKSLNSKHERDSLLDIAREITTNKSFNFTNVKFTKPKGDARFYDISNFTFNYAYSLSEKHDIETDHDLTKKYSGGLMYNFQNKPREFNPFQKSRLFQKKAFKLIKDFNFKLAPTNVSFQSTMDREYGETKARNITDPDILVETTVDKSFNWNRDYSIAFDPTRSLKLDFTASNIAKIDEPDGIVNRYDRSSYNRWKNVVWANIKNGGRTTHYEHEVRLTYTLPINKLPLLDWTSSNLQYTGTYNWDIATSSVDSLNTGNTIQNTSQYGVSGQLNFTTLYNKLPYFKRILKPQTAQKTNINGPAAKQPERTKKVEYQRENTFLNAGKAKTIIHKLKTLNVKVKIYDSENKEIKGKLDIVNENRITFTADSNYRNVKIVVEGQVEKGKGILSVIWESTVKVLLSVKNISFSYSKNGSSTLPGYTPKTEALGMDFSNNSAPGLKYVMGFQEKDFITNAIHKGWLSRNTYQSSPFQTTLGENITVRGTVEPIPGFKIDLNGSRSYSRNESSYFTADASGNFPTASRNYSRNGSFSMTFNTWGTAFEKTSSKNNYYSEAFERFKRYREVVSSRLSQVRSNNSLYNANTDPETGELLTDGSKNGYGLLSQDVLIPSFMAAYGNINPNKVTLNKFPSLLRVRPNWKISYDGLIKIPLVKKYCKSVSLSHSYLSTYNIGNYILNSDYSYDVASALSWARDLENNFVPELDVSSVSINEQINPLIGISVTTLSGVSLQFQIRKTRNVVLNVTSSQITESKTNELSIGTGYTIKDVRFTIKSGDGQKEYKSDLKLQGNLSVRDNKMIYRLLTQDSPEPASGQKVVTLKLSADYQLSSDFNLSLFFDRIVNTPFVSSSYTTVNTNVGFTIKYSLTQ